MQQHLAQPTPPSFITLSPKVFNSYVDQDNVMREANRFLGKQTSKLHTLVKTDDIVYI